MEIPLPEEWTQKCLIDYLSSRSSEDKFFECKASINFSWDLKNFTDPKGNRPFADKPFHSSKPANSYLTLRVIESIMAFANADGGLLLLGVAESRLPQGKPDCEGIKIKNQSGEVKFIINGVEEDQIGYELNGVFTEDKYIRQLDSILFPKIKLSLDGDTKQTKPCIYKKRTGKNEVNHFKRFFSENYNEALIQSIKLIPFFSADGARRTVAALIVKTSEKPIFMHMIADNNTVREGIYVRSTFNCNRFLEDEEMAIYLLDRAKERGKKVIIGPTKPPIPTLILKELENYVIPSIDDQPLPNKIFELINEERNVLILGESGLGKSLLMAHCFLKLDNKKQSCYYAIDRTQGPDVYQSAPVINRLRSQIEEIAGLPKIDRGASVGSKKDWVYERERLQNVLRKRAQEQPEKKLIIFLDGIDENFLETRETDFILNILEDLIADDSLGVIWVLSSQPRPGMNWIKDSFELLTLEGLGYTEAKELFSRHLPSGFDISYPEYHNGLIARARLDNELYDPEMIIMLGKSVTEKLGADSGKIRFISEDILKDFLGGLPLNPREKYRWLFDRYTDKSKLKDIPSLEENARRWNDSCQEIPYTSLLRDIIAILSIIRRPIPFDILSWALEVKDNNPTKDYRGREKPKFISYPERIEKDWGFLRDSLLDLQRFVKVIDQKEESCAFCKEAIRVSFTDFLSEGDKNSAKSRLAALASEEVQLIQCNKIEDRPTYITKELLYFFSLQPDTHLNSIEELFSFAFFPEWLERRAICEMDSDSQWTSDFIADLKLLDNLKLSEKTREHSRLLVTVIKDWRYFLDTILNVIAAFLRNENRLSQIWSPTLLNPALLVPINGYSRRIQGHSDEITSLAILPDGRLASSGRDYTIRIWNVNTGESSIVGECPSYFKIRAFRDGHLISYIDSYFDTDSIIIWNVNDGKHETLKKYFQGLADVQSIDSFIENFKSDVSTSNLLHLHDGRVAQPTDENNIEILDPKTNESSLLEGHTKSINSLSVLPNGNLVSGSKDNTIRIWDLANKKSVVLEGYNGDIVQPLSNDKLASNYGDNLIQIWDLKTKQPNVLGHKTPILSEITLLADGQLAFIADHNTIRIGNLDSEDFLVLEGHSDVIKYLITLPDGRLVSCSADRTIRIWDLSTNQSISLHGYGRNNDFLIAVSDNYLAALEADKAIKIWNIKTKTNFLLQETLEDEERLQFLVRIDNERIATFSDYPYPIRIWNINTKKSIPRKEYHESKYDCGTLLSDGRIALGCYGGVIQIWDIEKNMFVNIGEANLGNQLLGIALEEMFENLKELSNNHLASQLDNQPPILIWDLNTGEYFACEGAVDSNSTVEGLPDNLVAFCRMDKTVWILNLYNKEPIAVGFLEGRPKQMKYHQEKNCLIVLTTVGLEIFPLKNISDNKQILV